MLTDTHVHFDSLGGAAETVAVLERARAAGVNRFVAVGGDPAANAMAMDLATAHSGMVVAVAGYCRDLAEYPPPAADLEAAAADRARVRAIGEIGLDFMRCSASPESQVKLFELMLELARGLDLPVVVHSRAAERETLECLRRHAAARPKGSGPIGVMHCFTGSKDFALEAVALGFYISFSGIITFRNAAGVRAAAVATPEDRLLIETDSPYLAPEPHRGRPNEPALLGFVARAAAEIRGLAPERIAEITTANARELFGFG